ncbi:MAG TPA: NAD(P)/FAD-dependent oxidoreductase [Candidatus Limnocylindria bacterium]|nr:NAD(P)/FAD-dependent oxidoreductase [Candidatus Limnocylindria bacterium]
MTGGGSRYDAIVVGGGHNGLVCAAYLALDGLRTVVLERRREVGGMAATHELLPGVRVPALAHTLGRLRPSIVRDLHLREHGLALVQPEVRAWAPQPDGRSLTLWGDAERTAAHLADSGLVSAADARAYADNDGRLRALGSAIAVLMSRPPPDITHAGLGDALDGLRAGLAARARARSEPGGLLRVTPMSVADLLAEWFASDALRAVVAARALQYTSWEPRNPGTAALLLTDTAGNDGGMAGQTVYARGGPGALGQALESAARALGAEVRTGAEVVAVRRSGEAVCGVALASGEEVDAPVVVSGLDPRQTLLRLLEPEVLGPRLGWRAGNIRQRGATGKVNLALGALPAFRGLDGNGTDPRLRGRIVIAPTTTYVEQAARAGKYDRLADAPVLEATIPSLVDPGLVDTRRRRRKAAHVVSVIVQPAPYELRDAGWDAQRQTLGHGVLRTLDAYAPGIAELVEEMQVITPLDIESEWGATEGHALHAEAGLDQWFAWRPLHGYGRYRLPLEGLYLCGSGAHPGGGVTGGPGQLAAREVLADWARRRDRSHA